MEIETLGDVYTHGARLRMRCAKPRREGLKSVRACDFKYDLDVVTMLATRGRDFPISMLSSRVRCPRCGWSPGIVMVVFPSNPMRRAAE